MRIHANTQHVMRIHANTLARVDVLDAARAANATIAKLDDHGSRKRHHAFDVKLVGSETTRSRRRPNFDDYAGNYAATWDQWGVFLAVLFERDPSTFTTYDADAKSYQRRTAGRFMREQLVIGKGIVLVSAGWPQDYHGDHVFRFDGVPFEQKCSKCSAVQRWGS